MQQGMSLVRQLIAGEKRNMPTADRMQALEEVVSVLLVALVVYLSPADKYHRLTRPTFAGAKRPR